jgi:hypothetical protein
MCFLETKAFHMISLCDRIEKIIEEIDDMGDGGETVLAEIADTSKEIVHQWVSGTSSVMDYRSAKKISVTLGYEIEWLIHGRGAARKTQEESLSLAQGQEEQHVSNLARPLLINVNAEEMRLLIFCRRFPEAAKTFHRIAVDMQNKVMQK